MNDASNIGVIFDMDGVLVDSAGAHLQSWQRLAEELGQDVSPEQFARTFGRQNRDIIPLVFGEASEPRIRELGDRKETLYRDLVREHPPIMPGAIELVRSLADTGARLAVGSSAPRANIDLILSAMNVQDAMNAIVGGDDVTRGKPSPDVFLLAAERLGLKPTRCVVIEDAPVGVSAAKRAGMACIAVMTHHTRETLAEADLVVKNLSNLTAATTIALVT